MASFNRIDRDPNDFTKGSLFQVTDAKGRLVELNNEEAESLNRWLSSFLFAPPEKSYTQRALTIILRRLPQPISIVQREDSEDSGYVWTWLASRGESATFLGALEDVLTHIETSYTESQEL